MSSCMSFGNSPRKTGMCKELYAASQGNARIGPRPVSESANDDVAL